jgi:hypothetical protein
MPFFYGVVLCSFLAGQELPEGNIDIDSLFDEPVETPPEEPQAVSPQTTAPEPGIQKTGFTVRAGYNFSGGFFPGWSETPWHGDEYDAKSTCLPGLVMSSSLGFDFQFSDVLFVKNVFTFSFPDFAITVGDFYFDYTINKKIFIRAGKTRTSWGISPNYAYTDLLARSPSREQYGTDFEYAGEGDKPVSRYTAHTRNATYIAKADIPLGIGGLQFITMVHDDFFTTTNMQRELIAFGGKYNMAFTWADIDMGILYQEIMPLRGFVSAKTTLGQTELYAEALAAAGDTEIYADGSPITYTGGGATATYQPTGRRRIWEGAEFSGSAGFVQPLFDKKLTINGEFFYNGEKDAYWVTEEDITRKIDREVSPFVRGVNLAFNLSYRPRWLDFRFFLTCLYGVRENTAQLVPGFTFSPLSHVTVAFAVPMALGSREGSYYRNNADRDNRPFSIVLAFSIGANSTYEIMDRGR